MDRQKNVTIYDLAETTGFSVGTIYRALHGKGRIKEETRQLILDAATKAGYQANPVAQGLSRDPIVIGAILYCPVDEYVNDITQGIRVAAREIEKFNVSVDIHQIPYTTNRECREQTVALMQQFQASKYNGIVLFASSMKEDMAEIRHVIDEVTENGISVAVIASDIPESKRVFYVGINAFLAGQMAAEILTHTCLGKDVAILTSSMESDVNRQYVEGFYDYAGDTKFRSIRVYSHYDEREQVLHKTEEMIRENTELAGIYMTSASATAACQHIQSLNIGSYRIVMTDLLKETPQILKDGIALATIFQDPYKQGKIALMNLYHYLTSKQIRNNNSITPYIILSANASFYRNWEQ